MQAHTVETTSSVFYQGEPGIGVAERGSQFLSLFITRREVSCARYEH